MEGSLRGLSFEDARQIRDGRRRSLFRIGAGV